MRRRRLKMLPSNPGPDVELAAEAFIPLLMSLLQQAPHMPIVLYSWRRKDPRTGRWRGRD
jgi:hypothetical protein